MDTRGRQASGKTISSAGSRGQERPKKMKTTLAIMILLLSSLAMAADFTPTGNINGRGIYNITNFTRIYATAYYYNNGSIFTGGGTSTGNVTSLGTPSYLSKFSTTDLIVNSILYESSGKIGIATNTPSSILTVAGDINSTGSIYAGDGKVCTAANALCQEVAVESDPVFVANRTSIWTSINLRMLLSEFQTQNTSDWSAINSLTIQHKNENTFHSHRWSSHAQFSISIEIKRL